MNKGNSLILVLSSSLLIIIFATLFSRQARISQNTSQNSNQEVRDNLQSATCQPSDLSGEFDQNDLAAIFEGGTINLTSVAFADTVDQDVLGVAAEERWIEIDLSEQKLYAWEGEQLFLETPVSTGLPWWPTPTGEFRIWIKLRATKMEGGQGQYYYYLPNVPYVMFFENEEIPGWRGYGLHGTYWHNDFGTQRSHGCVNLPTDVAGRLYHWTTPNLPEGNSVARSSENNPGTRIVIHE